MWTTLITTQRLGTSGIARTVQRGISGTTRLGPVMLALYRDAMSARRMVFVLNVQCSMGFRLVSQEISVELLLRTARLFLRST